jgi:hypothetical protein
MKMFTHLPDFTEHFWCSQAQILCVEKDLKSCFCCQANSHMKVVSKAHADCTLKICEKLSTTMALETCLLTAFGNPFRCNSSFW